MRLPGRLFWLRDWRPAYVLWHRQARGAQVYWELPATWWPLPGEGKGLPGELREVHEGRVLLVGTRISEGPKVLVHTSDLRGAWVTDCTGGREGPFRRKAELHRAVRRALKVAEATLRLGGGAG